MRFHIGGQLHKFPLFEHPIRQVRVVADLSGAKARPGWHDESRPASADVAVAIAATAARLPTATTGTWAAAIAAAALLLLLVLLLIAVAMATATANHPSCQKQPSRVQMAVDVSSLKCFTETPATV